jgi:hypothetical protein
MAQTGFTPIQLYYSITAAASPIAANLANGELAINITDGKLFYKENTGTISVIGWKLVPTTAGGTGQTTYVNGQLLIGNSTGNTLTKATLTAGSGISVTNGTGSITLANTGVLSFDGGSTGLLPLTATTGVVSLSGTLGVGYGGTGQTTYTNGQLLIGNTTGNTLTKTTLTAGSGVSISNGAGSITISATGSGGTITAVTATTPILSSGGTTPDISIPAATTSVNGYLTSTDWNTFNSKGSGTVTSVAALTLGTTGTDLSSTVATGTTTPVITLNVPTASASNRGALSSADWTTFNNKGSGTVTSVTGTAPVVSSGGATPAISMAAATASVNGYLTSADWTTFNGKQAALVSGTNIKTVSGTTLLGSGDLGTIGATYGGTGQSSYAVGDLLYASTTTVLSKLADVATGNALISGGVGVAPSYGKIGLTTHVSGTLAVANGGTGVTSSTGSGNTVLSASPTLTGTVAGASLSLSSLTSGRITFATTSGLLTDSANLTFTSNYLRQSNTGSYSGGTNTFTNSIAGDNTLYIINSNSDGYGMSIQVNASDSSHRYIECYSSSASATKGIWYTDGNMRIAAGATYGNISDVKYKTNIVDATSKLNDLMNLKVRNFGTVENPDEKYIGFIAQEFEQVFPKLILETQDEIKVEEEVLDEDGNTTYQQKTKFLNSKTKGIKESALIPILVKAIQELKKDFDDYKASHP